MATNKSASAKKAPVKTKAEIKASQKAAKAARKANKPKRFAQIRDAYTLTRERDSKIGIWIGGTFGLTWAICIALGFIFGSPIYATVVSLPVAVLAAVFLFSRRAEKSAYDSIEGTTGAGASVLMSIRKGWTTEAAVEVNKMQSMVHRSIGRPGIVLVAEGGNDVRTLMLEHRRKMERFCPGTPITEIFVGDGEGRISIRKLQRHVQKLPRVLTPGQMREVRTRLKAVGGMNIPLPKGPMPKGARMPKPR